MISIRSAWPSRSSRCANWWRRGSRLSDLLNKLDGNDKLDELLQDVISSTDSLKKLGKEAGVTGPEDERIRKEDRYG